MPATPDDSRNDSSPADETAADDGTDPSAASATGGRKTSPPPAARHAETLRRLEKAAGRLASAAITRMDERAPWYRAMSAENRSWIGLVAQAGIAAFTDWFRHPGTPQTISTDVFGTAPRELTRAVTLRQTVEIVRTTIEVVEEAIEEVAAPGDEQALREAVLVYAREIAFATAQVYARAAEARGAWDARLEALVVNSLLSGEADEGVLSRAAALGWQSPEQVFVMTGTAPGGDSSLVVETIRRAARHAKLHVLTSVLGHRLVVIVGIGAEDELLGAARSLIGQFAPGTVVVGPPVPNLPAAARSAQAATSGLRASVAWPDAPRPVFADDLLPERAMAGDDPARHLLVQEIYVPLRDTGPTLLETLSVFLEQASSLEGAARLLFVHPNTVRYRLRRVADVTGYAPTEARSAFTLRIALTFGRLTEEESHL